MSTLRRMLATAAFYCCATSATALPQGCSRFSPNKIDYKDMTTKMVHGIGNETSCCDACRVHNAARPAGSPASTNCTVGVWYGCGPHAMDCALKATTRQPFQSSCVVAMQPQVLPPPPPPPPPLRFATIYTSHAVLKAAPSEQGVRLAQKMPVGPCIPAGIQLEKAEVGPISGPTGRLSR